MAIRRILIANRGEIAMRVIRTCERLGIETVLAASKADLDSLPARRADRTVCIGPAPAAQSYLNVPDHRAGRPGAGCDAIHPGYGFLSERADLARLCEEEGVIFIGPTAAADRGGRRQAARAGRGRGGGRARGPGRPGGDAWPKRSRSAARSARPCWSRRWAAAAGAA